MKRLVVATHNVKKGVEMATILRERFPNLEVLTLADFPGAPEPEETGSTYAENATIKAESAFRFTGEWCVSDDAGLEIDFFDGAPGLYSKRFCGEDTPFPEKMRFVLENMLDVPDERRGARFRCLVALTGPEHKTKVFEGVCEGRIGREQKGTFGFGYDPIFYVPDRECMMAELPPEEKHKISHRGKCLRIFGDYLERIVSPEP